MNKNKTQRTKKPKVTTLTNVPASRQQIVPFNPTKNFAATMSNTSIMALRKALTSLSAHTFKLVKGIIHRLLDPEHAPVSSVCTFSEGAQSTTIFHPKIATKLNLGPTGRWRAISFPRFRKALAVTDYVRTWPGSSRGSRAFKNDSLTDQSELVPPGSFNETQVGFAIRSNQPMPAVILESSEISNTSGIILPTWDGQHWVYHLGPAIANPGAPDADSRVRVTLGCDPLEGGAPNDVTVTFRNAGVSSVVTHTLTADASYQYADFETTNTAGYDSFFVTMDQMNQAVHSLRYEVVVPAPFQTEEACWFQESEIADTVSGAATSFILLGMSSWIQYQGSTLENGGTIAGYRLPSGNYPKIARLENTYEDISSIPGAYFGAMKNGSYLPWVPDSQKALDFQPLLETSPGNFTVTAGTVDDPTQSIRINFNQCMLVSTTNQAFPKATTVVSAEAWNVAISILRNAPTCIENSTHLPKISNVMKYLESASKLIAEGVKTIAEVAVIATPIIVGILNN